MIENGIFFTKDYFSKSFRILIFKDIIHGNNPISGHFIWLISMNVQQDE